MKMKNIRTTLATLLVFTLFMFSVNGHAEVDYPHAYPRAGVTKIFENDRGMAWNVEWHKNIEQPYHRHLYDMAGVYLRFGPIRVTRLDGSTSPRRPPFDIPRPYFQKKGVTHKEEVIGFAADAPMRWAIMFDLKEVDKAPLVTTPGMNAAFPRDNATIEIDNERVTLWDYAWTVGETLPKLFYTKDCVQVFYKAGEIQYTDVNGKVERRSFKIGDAYFIAAGTIQSQQAISGSPSAITIELK